MTVSDLKLTFADKNYPWWKNSKRATPDKEFKFFIHDATKEFEDKSEDKKNRLMFAELLVASNYGTGSSIVNNAFINSAFGIIKAKQIAAMISVISNVLPAVLGALADKDSKEKSDDKSSQSEPEQAEPMKKS